MPLSPRDRARALAIESHVKMAKAYAETGGQPSNSTDQQRVWFAAAQVEATLALVEAVQQLTEKMRR